MQGQREKSNKKARPRIRAGWGALARHRWTNLSTEGCRSPRSQAGLLTSGMCRPAPSRTIRSVADAGDATAVGRQPVTVAGPRQICTAFPILPLPFGSGHLRRFGSAIKRAELESVKGLLKIPTGFPRPNALKRAVFLDTLFLFKSIVSRKPCFGGGFGAADWRMSTPFS